MILCLIILKKINSLLIELGPLAVKTFLLDLLADLMNKRSCEGVFGDKRLKAVEIIENYCKKRLQMLDD